MKKKIFNILLIIVILFSGMFLTFDRSYITKVKADSGFDTSYDSGTSFSSDSSSHNSSFNSRSSLSSSSGGFNLSVKDIYTAPNTFGNIIIKIIYTVYFLVLFIAFIIFPIILIIFIIKLGIQNKKKAKADYDRFILSEEKVKEYIPNYDKDKFMKNRFDDYVKIQNAWMNFDYDTLRSMLTDELYNQYVMQLDTLKVKKEKNVMSDFVYKDGYVTNIKNENNMLIITIELEVEFYDYIKKEGTVVKGSNKHKITQHYGMTFVCIMGKNVKKCPNCGAKLGGKTFSKCEYCGSIVTGLSDKWVMSKKESWYQK